MKIHLHNNFQKRFLAYLIVFYGLLIGSLSVNAEDKRPDAKFTVTPIYGPIPLTVTLDASESSDDGSIKNYQWFFPDEQPQTTDEPTTEITIKNPGFHNIILVVTNNEGAIDVAYQPVLGIETPPTDETPNIPENNGDNPNTSDGTDNPDTPVDSEDNPSTEETSGTETGNKTPPPSAPENQYPIADFTYSVESFKVTLDASSSLDPDGTIANYEWRLPNGQNKSGKRANFTVENAGDYFITLIVTDNEGLTGEIGKSVTIEKPTTPNSGQQQLSYNLTARVYPQVLAAGVTPSKIDVTDSNFDIVALVRPGSSPIDKVIVQQPEGNAQLFVMTLAGVLPNGDEIYKAPYTFEVNSIKGTLSTTWGSAPDQYNITVTSNNQNHQSHSYPYLKMATYPLVDNSSARKSETSTIDYNTTARYDPQIIMAGYSPTLLDENDDQFDVIAVVRPGNLSIKQVVLKNDALQFNRAMESVGKWDNGDEVYKVTYTFEKGKLGNLDIDFKNFWGPNAKQFGIEVIDEGSGKSHKFPDIEFGNHPEYEPNS